MHLTGGGHRPPRTTTSTARARTPILRQSLHLETIPWAGRAPLKTIGIFTDVPRSTRWPPTWLPTTRRPSTRRATSFTPPRSITYLPYMHTGPTVASSCDVLPDRRHCRWAVSRCTEWQMVRTRIRSNPLWYDLVQASSHTRSQACPTLGARATAQARHSQILPARPILLRMLPVRPILLPPCWALPT